MKKAVILLSGGLDSSTILAMAKSRGYELYCLTFRYGQRHETEVNAAQRVGFSLGVKKHVIMDIDLRSFGGSALTDNFQVPKHQTLADMDISHDIPVTYVPARNTIFLSYALAFAEVLGATNIFIGVNALDYSGYPDCRPEYIEAYQKMANLATKAAVEGNRVKIHAPLIKLSKADIIKIGMQLGVDYSLTSTCYDPSDTGEACGHCDACLLRLKGFAESGFQDPVKYQTGS